MDIVTISPKFQVVVPREIRERMGLEPGQKVQALAYENRIEFIPVRALKTMRGFLRGMDVTVRRDRDRVCGVAWTQDDDFKDLPDVEYFPKAGARS